MEVNKELIIKYACNECTPWERLLVEQWLAEHNDLTNEFEDLSGDRQLKVQMWKNIKAKTRMNTQAAVRKLYVKIAAAAAVIVIVISNINPMFLSRTINLDNAAGETAKQVVVGDLSFKLQPGSSLSVQVPMFGRSISNVRFCGAITVENNSINDEKILVKPGADACNQLTGEDLVELHKGQTYLAMTDDVYHLITAKKNELEDGLPRSFSSRLSQKFKL